MRNRAGNTPLHEAVGNRRIAVALALIDAHLYMIHDVNGRHESPLEIASREGLVDVVRKVVDIPWVDAEFVEPFGGTALHQVVLGGHPSK